MGFIRNQGKLLAKKLFKGNDPDFLIIGAQKSGTTTLHYFLDQHPKLVGAFPKEVNFFSKFINYPGCDLAWYKRNFVSLTKWINSPLYFESTPNYFNNEDVPLRIKSTYPEIKLIVLVRDPVQRAFSAWNMYHDYLKTGCAKKRLAYGNAPGKENPVYQYFFKNRSSFPSFNETIAAELECIKRHDPGGPNILRKGLYYDQLSVYYQHFRKDQLLVLDFKELANQPGLICNKVLSFLGIDNLSGWIPKVKIKNKRSYDFSISEEETSILKEFYREPDRKLFETLQVPAMW